MDLYSSRTACDAVADRTVRNLDAEETALQKALRDAMMPFLRKIVDARKLSRPAYDDAWKALMRCVRRHEAAVDVWDASAKPGDASMKETRLVRFVTPVKTDDACLAFRMNEVRLTRHTYAHQWQTAPVVIGGHALSRFMQRERRMPKEFFAGTGRTLAAASVMTAMMGAAAGPRMALPFEDGLLLGEAWSYERAGAEDRLGGKLTVTKRGIEKKTGDTAEPSGPVQFATMKTYVEAGNLVDANLRIRDMLASWTAEHADGISHAMAMALYGTTGIPEGESVESVTEAARSAIDGAKAVMASPEWTRFSSRDGTWEEKDKRRRDA